MFTETAFHEITEITPARLLSLVPALTGAGRPSDDETPPHRPGPFDPIIRAATKEWLNLLAHHNPVLYDLPQWGRPVLRDHGSFVSLNPQPLPPRRFLLAALAEAVFARAQLLNELATALASETEKRGIIIVSGYVRRFVAEVTKPGFKLPLQPAARALHGQFGSEFSDWLDGDLCPTPWRVPIGWPRGFRFPWPHPEDPFWNEELHGGDLIILGAAFAQVAGRAFDENVSQAFADASTLLAQAGVSRTV